MTDYETIYQDARAKEFSKKGNRAPARVVQKAGLSAVVAFAKAEALEDFAAKWASWIAYDSPQIRGGASYRARAEAELYVEMNQGDS